MLEEALEVQVFTLLQRHGLTLVTAESCTGGLVGDLLTDVPGSSAIYLGGVVSYSNHLKTSLLGVPEALLETYGAVSEQVALAMARGARDRLGGDLGISVTGIAGPGGGSAEKPVGLTFIGASAPWGDRVQRFVWQGERRENKTASARAALRTLLDLLQAR
jgi:PncC family amidohydrolase